MIDKSYRTYPDYSMFFNSSIRILLPSETAVELTSNEEKEQAQVAAAEHKMKFGTSEHSQEEDENEMASGNGIEIFSNESISELKKNFSTMDNESSNAGGQIFESLSRKNGGTKKVPVISSHDITQLVHEFENMAEPIRFLANEFELMKHMPTEDFHIHPILLLGEPAIGKTAFVGALAKTLMLP